MEEERKKRDEKEEGKSYCRLRFGGEIGDDDFVFFLMRRRPPRSPPLYSSAASDVYKGQGLHVCMYARIPAYMVAYMNIYSSRCHHIWISDSI